MGDGDMRRADTSHVSVTLSRGTIHHQSQSQMQSNCDMTLNLEFSPTRRSSAPHVFY